MHMEQNSKAIKECTLKISFLSHPYIQVLQFPPLKASTITSLLCFLLQIFHSALMVEPDLSLPLLALSTWQHENAVL